MNAPQPPNPWNPPGGPSASTPLPGPVPGNVGDAAVESSTGPMRPIPTVVVFTIFAALAWLVVGAIGYNAASSFGPRVVEDAQILSLDIDFNSGSGTSTSRSTKWVEGETESGRSWRFASDEIYDIASSEGYPMDVEVTISTWTSSTIAVRGDSFDVDRSGRVAGVFWALATLLVLVVVLGVAWLILRKESMLAFATFMVTAPLWLWLGFLVMRSIRT